jgi:cullin-associated NEDD8-dissociated protein 1
MWPGNPLEAEGGFYTQCWDEDATITVRVADSCPCIYYLNTGEVFRQWWCCGGNNHFDLSHWGFEKLAHPTFGVMKMEFRPVDCVTNEPLAPLPGFVNQTIYDGSAPTGLQSGWNWLPYSAKEMVLLASEQGRAGGTAICGSLSEGGGVPFGCRQCTREGYRPFAKARSLQFWIRSNTQSTHPFASSTPPGTLPGLKVFLMNTDQELYCAKEVVLGRDVQPRGRDGDWYGFRIPLSSFGCDEGSSAKSLDNVDKVDFQNVNERDAEICLYGIALVPT